MIHPKFSINGKAFDSNALENGELFPQELASILQNWMSDEKLMKLQSSGTTTGEPKPIYLEKSKMMASAQMTVQFLGLRAGDTAWLTLSPKYIGGLMMVVRAMITGMNLHVDGPDMDSLVASKRPEQIDLGAMVPHQVMTLLERAPEKLRNIQNLLIGGGPVSGTLASDLKEVGGRVYSTFGMSETISHIALKQINGADSQAYYQTLPGISIQSIGGCLSIKAPGLLEEELLTRDRVEIHSPREFVWLGRSDFMINSGGVKIHPEKLEERLDNQLSCSFAFIGIPHSTLGQQLVLVVEGDVPTHLDWSDFQRYEIPKKVLSLSHFPRTDTGKIKRGVLQEIILDQLK
ncbi:AMP-binding protein [bacterium SCSIO 12741]|nr:AMP-binding protein [bacterium SCSIO 12741]